jgi:hypothetical protein
MLGDGQTNPSPAKPSRRWHNYFVQRWKGRCIDAKYADRERRSAPAFSFEEEIKSSAQHGSFEPRHAALPQPAAAAVVLGSDEQIFGPKQQVSAPGQCDNEAEKPPRQCYAISWAANGKWKFQQVFRSFFCSSSSSWFSC